MHAGYRPDIDGLRSLAVVPVVLFHAGLGLSGGFVGVDIFFVISGYLITVGLLKDNGADRFSIAQFYERRIRRIVPALVVVVLATLLAGALVLLPTELDQLGASAFSAALFWSNIHFWFVQNYFDGGNITHPLLHTWSLSVEEQFYILWPLVIWAVFRLKLSNWLPWLMILTIIATIVGSEMMLDYSPKTAFYMAPLRAWELMLGALLATGCVPQVRSRTLGHFLSFAALGMIAWSIFSLTEASRFPGIAAIPACAGAAILIHLGGPDRSIGNRILASFPLVWIGLISYSLYLWHWPILSLYTLHNGGGALTQAEGVALTLLSVLFAWLSWRFVERPFRKVHGSALARRKSFPVLAGGGAALAAVAGGGALLVVAHGFPGRVNAEARMIDSHKRESVTIATGCLVGDELPHDLMERCFSKPAERNARVAIWGDSFARQYANELRSRYHAEGVVPVMFIATGCAPLAGVTPTFGHGRADERCRKFNDFVLESLLDMPHLETIIIAGRWSNLHGLKLPGLDVSPTARFYIGKYGQARSLPRSLALMETSLDTEIEKLDARGVQVTLFAEPPRYAENMKRCAARAAWSQADVGNSCATTDVAQREFRQPVMAVLQRVAEQHGAVRLYDPLTHFCAENGRCEGYRDGKLITEDVDHLSRWGSVIGLEGWSLPMPKAGAK